MAPESQAATVSRRPRRIALSELTGKIGAGLRWIALLEPTGKPGSGARGLSRIALLASVGKIRCVPPAVTSPLRPLTR
jgi:hypothetical protein